MPQYYRIVKKNSAEHQAVQQSPQYKNSDVLPVDSTHILVPSSRPVDVGYNVSHAKNRVIRRRLPNLRTMHLQVGESKVTVQLTAHDLRTYHKLTKSE